MEEPPRSGDTADEVRLSSERARGAASHGPGSAQARSGGEGAAGEAAAQDQKKKRSYGKWSEEEEHTFFEVLKVSGWPAARAARAGREPRFPPRPQRPSPRLCRANSLCRPQEKRTWRSWRRG